MSEEIIEEVWKQYSKGKGTVGDNVIETNRKKLSAILTRFLVSKGKNITHATISDTLKSLFYETGDINNFPSHTSTMMTEQDVKGIAALAITRIHSLPSQPTQQLAQPPAQATQATPVAQAAPVQRRNVRSPPKAYSPPKVSPPKLPMPATLMMPANPMIEHASSKDIAEFYPPIPNYYTQANKQKILSDEAKAYLRKLYDSTDYMKRLDKYLEYMAEYMSILPYSFSGNLANYFRDVKIKFRTLFNQGGFPFLAPHGFVWSVSARDGQNPMTGNLLKNDQLQYLVNSKDTDHATVKSLKRAMAILELFKSPHYLLGWVPMAIVGVDNKTSYVDIGYVKLEGKTEKLRWRTLDLSSIVGYILFFPGPQESSNGVPSAQVLSQVNQIDAEYDKMKEHAAFKLRNAPNPNASVTSYAKNNFKLQTLLPLEAFADVQPFGDENGAILSSYLNVIKDVLGSPEYNSLNNQYLSSLHDSDYKTFIHDLLVKQNEALSPGLKHQHPSIIHVWVPISLIYSWYKGNVSKDLTEVIRVCKSSPTPVKWILMRFSTAAKNFVTKKEDKVQSTISSKYHIAINMKLVLPKRVTTNLIQIRWNTLWKWIKLFPNKADPRIIDERYDAEVDDHVAVLHIKPVMQGDVAGPSVQQPKVEDEFDPSKNANLLQIIHDVYKPVLCAVDTYHDMKDVKTIINDYRAFIDNSVKKVLSKASKDGLLSSATQNRISALFGHTGNIQLSFTENGRVMSIEKFLTNTFESSEHLQYLGSSKLGNPSLPLVPYQYHELTPSVMQSLQSQLSCVIDMGYAKDGSGIHVIKDKANLSSRFMSIMKAFFGDCYFIIDRTIIPLEWYDDQRILVTGASYFDGSTTNGEHINVNAKVSQPTGELFYLKNITVDNDRLLINNEPFSSSLHSKHWAECRPNVGKKAEAINNYLSIKYPLCYAQHENQPDNFTNFMLDMKRSGDALQVQSCIELQDRYNVVFVTHDTIAATHARMMGLNVMYTHIDLDRSRMLYLFRTTHNNKEIWIRQFNDKVTLLSRFIDYMVNSQFSSQVEFETYKSDMKKINGKLNRNIPLFFQRLLNIPVSDFATVLTCFVVETLVKRATYNNFNLFYIKLNTFISNEKNKKGWEEIVAMKNANDPRELPKVNAAIKLIEGWQSSHRVSNLIEKPQLLFYNSYMDLVFIPKFVDFLADCRDFNESHVLERFKQLLTDLHQGYETHPMRINSDGHIMHNIIDVTLYQTALETLSSQGKLDWSFVQFFQWVVESSLDVVADAHHNLARGQSRDIVDQMLAAQGVGIEKKTDKRKRENSASARSAPRKKQRLQQDGGGDALRLESLVLLSRYYMHARPPMVAGLYMYLTGLMYHVPKQSSVYAALQDIKAGLKTSPVVLSDIIEKALIVKHPNTSLLDIGILYSKKGFDYMFSSKTKKHQVPKYPKNINNKRARSQDRSRSRSSSSGRKHIKLPPTPEKSK